MRKEIFTLALLMSVFSLTFGQSYIINRVGSDAEITLDGVADEIVWADERVGEETLGSVLLGEEGAQPTAPEDAFDYEVKFKALYSDAGLYFLINVSDMDVDTVSEKDDGEGWPRVDVLEFYFMFGDGSTMPADKANIWDACQYGVFQIPVDLTAPDLTGGPGACYVPWKNTTTSDGVADSIISIKTFSDDGYVIEQFIMWDMFQDHNGDPVTPAADLEFTLELGGMDRDIDYTPDEPVVYSHVYWKSTGHVWNWPWTDFNPGKAVLSADVISNVADLKTVNGVRVFPNPAVDMLNVQGDVDAVKIYSVVGKEFYNFSLNSNKTVNISNLDQGLYFISLYKDTQLVSTRKFIKAE